jgi:hypothetical protein
LECRGTYPPQVGQGWGRCPFAFAWESDCVSALFRRWGCGKLSATADARDGSPTGTAVPADEDAEIVGVDVAACEAVAAAELGSIVADAASYIGGTDLTCTRS